MSIQLVNKIAPTSTEGSAKAGPAGDKPQGEASFSAVLADRRRADTPADTRTTDAPKQAPSSPQARIAQLTDKQQAGADGDGVPRDTAAKRHGDIDLASAKTRPARGDQIALTDLTGEARPAGDPRPSDLAETLDLEPATQAEPAHASSHDEASDNDATVFADIRWHTIAVSLQHNTGTAVAAKGALPAGAHTAINASAADTRMAGATTDLQLALSGTGQAGAQDGRAAIEWRTLDTRSARAGRADNDSGLRLAAAGDAALNRQGDEALAADRSRIAFGAQHMPTDARNNPAAWAAFTGDVQTQSFGKRFASAAGTEATDAADLKSLPGTATSIQAGTNPALATSAPAATLSANINAPLGSEAWKQAINQQALRLSHVGDGAAELTLYPRELGQLHVSLKMGENAQLHFASAHADVRAAVEAALPQLRQTLADNGINLGQTSVSDQGTNSNASNGDGSGRAQGGRMPADSTDVASADTLTAPVAVTTLAGRTLDGGIDIFA
ncbi:flagellar hook-length control protein [Salinisphaera sp. T5B8]|uniref:flagellar hook-length control protein FliK n=1 Tax=Salinisphaera sp. T5B8 TaxID=1304154 RepID=UPI00333FA4DE